MRARSDLLSGAGGPLRSEKKKRQVIRRMAPAERKAMLLARATDFFAEYGLTAQTRALADACGVAQRLLYRYFPSKSALLQQVYEEAIVAPFKAVWLVQLKDRSQPFETRLTAFYRHYYEAVLTRKWLRLFLYASLAEARIAPDYIQAIIMEILETIVVEAAADRQLELPRSREIRNEIAWTLHGAVSHFAIRRHLYMASQSVNADDVLALHIRAFLAAFADIVAEARARERGKADFAVTGAR
jgi:AcrR family transcriptional regulator